MRILIKRAYDQPSPRDGLQILVDRLWPRGLNKENAKIGVWLKTAAPSDTLRKGYQHDLQQWSEFKKRYFAELDTNPEAITELVKYVRKRNTTFLFAPKEPEQNNAVALKEYIILALSN